MRATGFPEAAGRRVLYQQFHDARNDAGDHPSRPALPRGYRAGRLRRFSLGHGVPPEGPFESVAGGVVENPPPSRDAGDFLELFERLQREADHTLGLDADQRELRMIVHLVRNHLAGKLVIATSLATASGLGYGTAMR